MKKILSFVVMMLVATGTAVSMVMESVRPEFPKSPPNEVIDAETELQMQQRHDNDRFDIGARRDYDAEQLRKQQEREAAGGDLSQATREALNKKYGSLVVRDGGTVVVNPKHLSEVHADQARDLTEQAEIEHAELQNQHDAERAGKSLRLKLEARRQQQEADASEKRKEQERAANRKKASDLVHRVQSDTKSMTTVQAYDRLGLSPGANEAEIKAALKSKIEETQGKQDRGDLSEDDSAYEQAMLNQAGQKAGADSVSTFNEHGQRVDKDGNVVETWGEKFDRWMQSAKRRFFGSDRATQIALKLVDLNKEGKQAEFEAAVKELKYELRRHPGQLDKVRNAYRKKIMEEGGYHKDVHNAIQDALPADQEFVYDEDTGYSVAKKKPVEMSSVPAPTTGPVVGADYSV